MIVLLFPSVAGRIMVYHILNDNREAQKQPRHTTIETSDRQRALTKKIDDLLPFVQGLCQHPTTTAKKKLHVVHTDSAEQEQKQKDCP